MDWQYIQVMDPGKSTGVACGEFSDVSPLEIYDVATMDQDQIFQMLDRWTEVFIPPTRVVESFTLRGSNEFTANLAGVEIIGAIKFLMRTQGLEVTWRTPSQKSAIPDSTLKALGEWRTGTTAGWLISDPTIRKTGRHVNDAICHAYGHMVSIGHQPTIRKIEEALNV